VTRVLFTLTMPGRNTWNGKWSGDERNYTIVRSLGPVALERVFGPPGKRDHASFGYSWPDGWHAQVEARIVAPRERPRKSDGFCGYNWMVDSILRYGTIYADHQRPAEVSP
jgi:hypothetical protein